MTIINSRLLFGTVAVLCAVSADLSWAKQRAAKASGQIFAAGEPLRSGSRVTKVDVALVEVSGKAIFAPNALAFRRGTKVRFLIRNDTSATHEFVIGSHTENIAHAETMKLSPAVEHDEPNARVIRPHSTAVLDWYFTKSGSFEFSCLRNGHAEIEEDGKIVIE